jgi:thiamine pyrophosphokinase
MLRKASVVIACDGAAEQLHRRGFTPDAIIGDLDSISPVMQELYADRIHVDTGQETNDLTKAVHFAHQSGEKNVLIVGASGLREDHTLGNISLLSDYGTLLKSVAMITDHGIFTPFYKTTTFESRPGEQISIFSLTPEVQVTTENLRYPLSGRPLTSWWQGTLNEALGYTFTLRLSSNGRFILYRLLP